MNKKIITLAIAAIGMMSISACAQSSNNNCNQACQKECKAQAPGDNNKMYQPSTFTDIAFEGILLDVNQQAAIDKINAQYKDQLAPKGKRPEGPKGECCKKDCKKANCDSAKCKNPAECPALNDGQRPERKNMNEVRRQYANEVKSVLTPEQYVVFLENIAFNQPQQPKMGKMGKQCDKAKKGNKDGKGRQEMKAQGQKADKSNKTK